MPPSHAPDGVRLPLRDIARFLLIGAAATAVSVLGFNALVHGILVGAAPLSSRPITAFVLINVVAGLIAYAGIRVWAFGDRHVHRPLKSLSRFFVLGALTMAVPVVCLAVSRYGLGFSSVWADNISGNVVGLGVGTAMRFWLFRRYVFIDSDPASRR